MGDLVEYGDMHRAILQTVMGHGTIHKNALKDVFVILSQENQQMEVTNLKKVIDMINEKIQQFDQKITEHQYGLTNEEFYVFHSTAKTSMSKLQNSFSIDELDFFKLILTKIVENDQLTIAPIDALNLCNLTSGKINKLRAQKLLEIWIQNHYLYKHVDDNKIYLGARLLTEFKELLQNMELDYLKSCLLCENIAIWGDRCASCDTIYHSPCIQKFLTRSDKCPSCKERWEVPVDN